MNNKILYMLILLVLLIMFPLAWSWFINEDEGFEVEKNEKFEVPETNSVDDSNMFKKLQMLADGSPLVDILDTKKVEEHQHSALEQGQFDLKNSIAEIQNMLNSPDIKAIRAEANGEGNADWNKINKEVVDTAEAEAEEQNSEPSKPPIPTTPGCYFHSDTGCPKRKGKKRLNKTGVWIKDTWGMKKKGSGESKEKCDARAKRINKYCGVTDFTMQYVPVNQEKRDETTTATDTSSVSTCNFSSTVGSGSGPGSGPGSVGSSGSTIGSGCSAIGSGSGSESGSGSGSGSGSLTDRCNIELSDTQAICYLARNLDLRDSYIHLNNEDKISQAKDHWKKNGCSSTREYNCVSNIEGSGSVLNNVTKVVFTHADGNTLTIIDGPDGKYVESKDGTKYIISSTVEELNVDSPSVSVRVYVSHGNGSISLLRDANNPSKTMVIDNKRNKYIIDKSMYAGQSSFNESSVPLFENDKYILKTQVVPPVCPTCPGLGSAPYSSGSGSVGSGSVGSGSGSGSVGSGPVERRQQRQEYRQQNRQQRQEDRQQRQEDQRQNNIVAPHLNAQREFNQSNNDYDFGPNSLTNNNNLDNYEPQAVLNNFSNF